MPVLATTLLGGLLVLAAYAGPTMLAVTAVFGSVVLAYGLVTSADLPDRVAAGALTVLTSAGAVVALRTTDPVLGAETSFAPVLRAAGPAVVAVLLVALASPRVRDQAIGWVSVAATGVVLGAFGASVVVLGRLPESGPELVAAGSAGAVLGSAVVQVLERWGWLWPLTGAALTVGGALLLPVGALPAAERLVVLVATAVVSAVTSLAVVRSDDRSPGADRPAADRVARAALVAGAALAVAAPTSAVLARLMGT